MTDHFAREDPYLSSRVVRITLKLHKDEVWTIKLDLGEPVSLRLKKEFTYILDGLCVRK